MGIFNFFSDKNAAKPADSENPAGAHRTLVAIEWTKIKEQAQDLAFLDQYDAPLAWFFERRPDLDGEAALIGLPHSYRIIEIPRDERNSTVFIANSVLFELLTQQNLKKAIFVSANNQFRGTVEFLKSKGFDADTLLFEVPAELRATMPNRNLAPANRDRNERTEERAPRPERSPRVQQNARPVAAPVMPRQAAPVSPEVEAHAEQISSLYNERFLPGEVYPKSKFGVLIKHATGKTNEEVFLSKNAKVFINGLMHKGLVAEVDSQSLRIVAPLPLAEIRSIIVFAHKRASRKPAGQPSGQQNSQNFGAQGFANQGNNFQHREPQFAPNTDFENEDNNPYAEGEASLGNDEYAKAYEQQPEAALQS